MSFSKQIIKKLIIMLISVLFCYTMSLSAQSATPQEAQKLNNGEIITKALVVDSNSKLRGAEAKILIQAPPEKVWNIIDDQENIPKVVPKIRQNTILEKTDQYQKVQSAIKVSKFLPLFRYTVILDQSEKYKRIKFNKVAGCFNQLYGSCEFEPYQNGTILTYKMYIDPGFPVPADICDNGLKRDLPEVLTSIKLQAENSIN